MTELPESDDACQSTTDLTASERQQLELAAELAAAAVSETVGPTVVGAFVLRENSVVALAYLEPTAWELKPAKMVTGHNGGRMGFTAEGRKVEWIPSDEVEGEFVGMFVRRSDTEISNAAAEFSDKVWWNRHQLWLERIQSGEESSDHPSFPKAREAARRIEAEYGRQNLGWSDFDWGMLNGRLSALAWVLGSDWDSSLDT
ncbi:hypothetical protein FN976_25620 [Caenimonas sedimenti]|uniref:Uncharacterized protein n=1 Tax=Caenimonas sedimenti TaxID=2596921 RepID=A0A562ZHA4_9BURK|nr:VENN motif pre-toxin domain-containing protein [Caenimonas sedimenti]TWO67767.1 hypothetical protein FN976_25620 [Caenimonas sedimenti]